MKYDRLCQVVVVYFKELKKKAVVLTFMETLRIERVQAMLIIC